jgi:hypothetical protein
MPYRREESVATNMTDLQMTLLCAKAMGHDVIVQAEVVRFDRWSTYDPLNDDAQAMALVKKFQLEIGWYVGGRAAVNHPDNEFPNWIESDTLNRAVVMCVAMRHAERATA